MRGSNFGAKNARNSVVRLYLFGGRQEKEREMEMEGKRYSLRSGSCRQTKLEFPCRRGGWRSEAAGPGKKTTKKKREQAPLLLEPADCADENESPPKRSRVSGKLARDLAAAVIRWL